ncbi:MAG: VCBS repeat-containing protein [Deltaproteobacteria bacterium]|nr:VCBS repeat-containing protein [Deltaproteobacteria bacterium]
MRTRSFLAVIAILMAFTANSLEAQAGKRVAILPFAVHSSEDLGYVKNGVWDMLMSRVASSGEVSVLDKSAVMKSLDGRTEDLTPQDIYDIGGGLSVDYVVWGSITKIGSSISLDGKMIDTATREMPVGVFEQCKSLDEVIPKIGIFAQKVTFHILGKTPVAQTYQAPAVGTAALPAPQPPQAGEASKALATERGTITSIINPEFITEGGALDRKGFWMSPQYPQQFIGMDIGDVNGDGFNETVVIDNRTVLIYQRKDREFSLLSKHQGGQHDRYLGVDIADVNGNGISEIFITNFRSNNRVASFVLEFRDGRYAEISSELPWFLRVIDRKSQRPMLLGQRLGIDLPFERPIYEMGWSRGQYDEVRRMDIPEGIPLYGLTVDSVEGEGRPERVIAFDDYDYIRLYAKTTKNIDKVLIIGGSDEALWKSDEQYAGSDNSFDLIRNQGSDSKALPVTYYLNGRLLTYDIDKNGKKEIIVVKNHAPGGRVMDSLRFFSSGEIYNFEWDGMGLAEKWKTRKLQGYVADYQIKDIDNDKENELVLLLKMGRRKSVIVAYDLNVQ